MNRRYNLPDRVYAIHPLSVAIPKVTRSVKACSINLTSATCVPRMENKNKRPSSNNTKRRSDKVHPIVIILECDHSFPDICAN